MAIRTATIFGGSGFIGRYVVRELAKTGASIRVAVRHPNQALFLKPCGDVGQIVPMLTNVRNLESVRNAVDGADVVINLVGVLSERGAQKFDAVHRAGCENVARAAADAGAARLIHFSSIGADPAAESAYARTKGDGERAVRSAFPNATVVRPSVVFGPEDDFFNRFAAMARLSPVLPLIGGGATRLQPVFVGDIADAVMAMLADPATAGDTFELGGPKVYTFKELMEILLAEVRRNRALVPIPFWMASALGAVLGLVPTLSLGFIATPPLTADQVTQLRRDNVVSAGSKGLVTLGVAATTLDVILPTYLERFRKGGTRVAQVA